VTVEEYWAAIGRIPLYRDRDTTDGKGVICRTFNNQPVHVDKPDVFTEAEREAMVAFYRLMYAPQRKSCYCETMDTVAQIRAWLAAHQIEPAELTCETAVGVIAIKISFKSPEDERLFDEHCPWGKKQSEDRRERIRQLNLGQLRP